jgi:hypothetical protein
MLLMPAVANRGCILGFPLEASLKGLPTECCFGVPLLVLLVLLKLLWISP